MAGKGKRGHVCNVKTADMHWQSLRQFLGFLNPAGPVNIAEQLTYENFRMYYHHLEVSQTIRKKRYSPGTVGLITRGLSVTLQCYGPAGQDDQPKRKQQNRLAKLLAKLRALSRSVQDC
jgi:hypothetical protein